MKIKLLRSWSLMFVVAIALCAGCANIDASKVQPTNPFGGMKGQ